MLFFFGLACRAGALAEAGLRAGLAARLAARLDEDFFAAFRVDREADLRAAFRAEIKERDRRRWELDPASSEDYIDRVREDGDRKS